MLGAMLAAAAWAVAPTAMAHDTFIVPPATVTVGQPIVVQITSSSFFPEPETRIRVERMAHVDARADGQPLTWTATADDIAMTLTTSPAPSADRGAVISVSLAPYDIDVGADEIDHYVDEIGASAAVRAAVSASVATNGTLRETYTKHLKTIVCATTCADNAESGTDTFEFVADPDTPGTFTLFLRGHSSPNHPAFVVTDNGGRVALITDANGRVTLPEGLTGLVYLNAVELSPPATPDARFTSQWASLTFDARLLNP